MPAPASSTPSPFTVGGFGIRLEGPLWDGRGGELLGEIMRVALVAGATRIETLAAQATPVNTGLLRQSIGRAIAAEGPLVAGVPRRITAVVGSPLVYAPHVEAGTRPHWPPPAPIEAWVRRKLRDEVSEMAAADEAKVRAGRRAATLAGAGATSAQRRRLAGTIARERAIRRLTFLVQRKIARHGTKGAHMLRTALERERPWVLRAIRAGLEHWVTQV